MNGIAQAVVATVRHRAVRRVCFAYPFLVLTSYYLVWLTAWAVLGHPPRYLLDDPKYISWVVDVPLLLSGLLTYASPNALLAAVVALSIGRMGEPASRRERALKVLRDLGLLGLCWVAAIAWLRFDPGNVIEWYFD